MGSVAGASGGHRGSVRRLPTAGKDGKASYVSVSVRWLESGAWLDVCNGVAAKLEADRPGSSRWVAGAGLSVLLLLWTLIDVLALCSTLCRVLVPVAAIVCGYLLLALTFRNSWTATGIYVTFCGGVVGEIVGACLFNALSTLSNVSSVSIYSIINISLFIFINGISIISSFLIY